MQIPQTAGTHTSMTDLQVTTTDRVSCSSHKSNYFPSVGSHSLRLRGIPYFLHNVNWHYFQTDHQAFIKLKRTIILAQTTELALLNRLKKFTRGFLVPSRDLQPTHSDCYTAGKR